MNSMNTTTDSLAHGYSQDPILIAHSERKAALVIDINGCIIECTLATTDLLGQTPEALVGQDFSVVFPGLPFPQETPGYNLAYVGMNHAVNVWEKCTAFIPSGGSIAVEIAHYLIKRGSKNFIVLFLRRPSSSADTDA